MQCRKCHAAIPDGSNFCLKCGARQNVQRKPKARGNGTGSVFKRSNGTWTAMRTIGWTIGEDGKARKKTASKSGFKTKREAIEYLPILADRKKAIKRTTFRELYDAWEPTHKKSKSTLNCYRAAMNYFRPVWCEPVTEITVDDLQECMDDCEHGKRTKENMKALCNLLYKYAIPRNLATLNMGQYLVINAQSGGKKEGLPQEALEALLRAVGRVPYADYVVAQCYLGFRPSELLALDCKNYDRERRAIVGGAKTDAGKDRTVTISPKIQPIIDRRAKGKIAGPLFPGKDGGQMRIEMYREIFYNVLEQCGIDNPVTEENGVQKHRYTPHSCRHTFATLMKKVNAPDKDKLELIGHTSAEMMRHYQDVDIESLRHITDAI